MPEQVGASTGSDRVLTVPELTHVSRFAEAKAELLDRAAATVGDWQRGLSARELLDPLPICPLPGPRRPRARRYCSGAAVPGGPRGDASGGSRTCPRLHTWRDRGRWPCPHDGPGRHRRHAVLGRQRPVRVVCRGPPIYLVVHPQIGVRRDVMGNCLGCATRTQRLRIEIPTRLRANLSWSRGSASRLIARPNWTTSSPSRPRWNAYSAMCVRRSRTGLGCARPHCHWPSRSAGRRSLPVGRDEVDDAVDLLRWLPEDHFTFLGYREYALEQSRW